MADFRRWLYALALAALLSGLAQSRREAPVDLVEQQIPISAQSPPLECIANAGTPPTVRAEGSTELLGDITLNCTGGVPTPAGQVVPPVDVTVTINAYLTSRYLATCKNGGGCLDALLIIDEPHSAINPGRPILACGAGSAPDNGPSGRNVCAIVSTGDPTMTYDGTPNGYGMATGPTACTGSGGTPGANAYGCGRPNLFQGQAVAPAFAGQTNVVTWLGVPLDPPGTTTNRIIRVTNIRADVNHADGIATAGTLTASYIQASISINGNAWLSLRNPQQIVGVVAPGAISSVSSTELGAPPGVGGTSGGGLQAFVASLTLTEGFADAWRPTKVPEGAPQGPKRDVPGAIYNTEYGFLNPDGTHLQVRVSNIPAGVTVSVPEAIYLSSRDGVNSGIAALVKADTSGDAFWYYGTSAAAATTTYTALAPGGVAIYEVLFADPSSVERMAVPIVASYAPGRGSLSPISLDVGGGMIVWCSGSTAISPLAASGDLHTALGGCCSGLPSGDEHRINIIPLSAHDLQALGLKVDTRPPPGARASDPRQLVAGSEDPRIASQPSRRWSFRPARATCLEVTTVSSVRCAAEDADGWSRSSLVSAPFSPRPPPPTKS